MSNKCFNFISKCLILVLALGFLTITGCKKDEPVEPDKPVVPDKEEIVTTVETWKIMTGTVFETPVYKFTSNVEGPRIAVIGGIHGDECAGWECALDLVQRENYFHGEVLIIPQANILGDQQKNRTPVGGDATGKYQNLNRVFPGKQNGTTTEKLCYEIVQTVEEFAPVACIDLHESVRPWSHPTAPRLGNSIICGNGMTSLFAEDITKIYNKTYLLPGEPVFQLDDHAVQGGCCWHFGRTHEDWVVFTIETDRRKTENGYGEDTQLERRVEQQTHLMEIFFDLMWEN